MNIEKERELFEAWCVKDDEFCIHRYVGDDKYSEWDTQAAWDAWQASASREGYKMVPVDTIQHAIGWAYIAKWDSPSNEDEKEIQHHEDVLRDMLGAVE